MSKTAILAAQMMAPTKVVLINHNLLQRKLLLKYHQLENRYPYP
jgi:hypothetical protein